MSTRINVFGASNRENYTYIRNGITTTNEIYSEYIEYKLPLVITPISSTITYATDSYPVSWILFGKRDNGPWYWLTNNTMETYNSSDLTVNTPVTNFITKDTTPVPVDTFRLVVQLSTGGSVKIANLTINDQIGKHVPFLVPFCTNTNSMYHSGSLNFSQIDSFSIDANLDTDFYAVGHSIIDIENGMCVSYR